MEEQDCEGGCQRECRGGEYSWRQVEFCCLLEAANLFMYFFLHLIPKRFKSKNVQ